MHGGEKSDPIMPCPSRLPALFVWARRLLACLAVIVGAANAPPLATPALAAPTAADCAPLEPPEGYVADNPPELDPNNVVFFPVENRDGTKHERVTGATCRQNYRPSNQQSQRTDIDIQDIFQRQIMGAGGDILFTDDGLTSARLQEENSETWIMIYSEELLIQVTVVKRAR